MAKVELPDLESQTDVEIVKENLHAAQAIYFAYQLEEMRLFQVVERIVELFQQGQLPLGRGNAGRGWSSVALASAAAGERTAQCVLANVRRGARRRCESRRAELRICVAVDAFRLRGVGVCA